jgi:nicotianamine synthase
MFPSLFFSISFSNPNTLTQEANPSKASTKPTSPRTILTTFPYYTNYTHLSRLEFSAVSAFLPTAPSSIAFIGSGPLPLSSLCFLDSHPNATVHNIDRDAAALSVSAELCSKLGYGGMTFSCEDVMIEGSGCGKDAWETFDVVFLAALVGNDTHSKLSILGSLARKLRKGALVVARSARGVRGVLYPVCSFLVF